MADIQFKVESINQLEQKSLFHKICLWLKTTSLVWQFQWISWKNQ